MKTELTVFRAQEVFLSWVITLLGGLLIGTVGFSSFPIAFYVTLLAGLISVPYVIIMSILVSKFSSFWMLQIVHVLLSVLTIGAMQLISGTEADLIYYLPVIYFIGGFAVQGALWLIRENKVLDEKNRDLGKSKPTQN